MTRKTNSSYMPAPIAKTTCCNNFSSLVVIKYSGALSIIIVNRNAHPILSNSIVNKYSPLIWVASNSFFCLKKAMIKPIRKVPPKP